MNSIGNDKLLALPITAFLCSRKVPVSIVLKCFDWAIRQRNGNRCIMSGFHSKIEKDVLHYLLKGKQPIILVLARGLKKNYEPELAHTLTNGQLLIVSPFHNTVTRASQNTAYKRNEYMAEIADEIFVAYAQTNGNIERLVMKWLKEGKRVSTFEVAENLALIKAGAVQI